MNRLLIQIRNGNFWHRRNENPLTDRNVSDFEVSIDENFVLVELDGSQSFIYKVENVTIQLGVSGTIESFTNRDVLLNRLTELNYTPYIKVENSTISVTKFIRQIEIFQSFTTIVTIPANAMVSTITNKDNLSKVIDFTQTGQNLKITSNAEIGDTIEILFN